MLQAFEVGHSKMFGNMIMISQDLETGHQKLASVTFLCTLLFKGDHNIYSDITSIIMLLLL